MQSSFFVGIIAFGAIAAGAAWSNAEVETGFIPEEMIESHRIEATSCTEPRSFRRIIMKGGIEFARAGEVFAFEPRVIRAARCEEVEIIFENTDAVRHALMLPGLNPMFALEFTGPATRSLRFITPDEDITLEFHCHVPTHEQMGMSGRLIVGEGGSVAHPEPSETVSVLLFEAIGTVVAVDRRTGRIVLTHGEIPGFMAAMVEMSFAVSPATLLGGIELDDQVRFTVDANKRMIVDVIQLSR